MALNPRRRSGEPAVSDADHSAVMIEIDTRSVVASIFTSGVSVRPAPVNAVWIAAVISRT